MQNPTTTTTASAQPENVQMNTLDTYADCGRKAGKAATHRDFALVRFHNDWFHRAIRLESKSYATEATRVFNEAYRQERI